MPRTRRRRTEASVAPADAERAEVRIDEAFAAYAPATRALGSALRARLRERLPGLHELVYVYERQGALVLSYSPTEAGAQAVCALAVRPDRVALCLAGGARLAASDPQGLLRGRGKAMREVEIGSTADFDRPAIEMLIAAALRHTKVRLHPGARSSVILKMDQQRQRARRRRLVTRRVTRRTTGPAGRTPRAARSAGAPRPRRGA